MKRILTLLILTSLVCCGYAQKRGTLHVNQDSRIDRLMKRQRDVYAANNTMNGYRVQIFMEIGNDAIAHAEAVKGAFTSAFPELPVYLTYEQPYYRLRVGDFRNRVEAEKYVRLIKPKFNLAFVTADVINPPKKLSPVDPDELLDDEEETGEDFND
ncbi:MAG: SPOR domain-containing protein [Bacteroidales bacterium]|nr:SPOR domain-containing protein [Bacteroidales bacterium]